MSTDMSYSTSDHYAPDRLQKIALSLMGGMVVMTFVLTNVQAVLWQSSQWLVGAVLPAVVVQLTNEERSDLNASPLRRSSVLDAAAKMKAEHMAKNQYFAHYAPDGTTPWHWFDQAGYTYAHAGENLAIHFTDSDEVVEAWMNSPAHRDNIVSGKFTEIGVGTAKGVYNGSNTVYVVQLFGAPAFVPPAPTPAAVPPPSTVAAVDVPLPQSLPSSVTEVGPTVAAAETEVVEVNSTVPANEVVEKPVITEPVDSPVTEKPVTTLEPTNEEVEVRDVIDAVPTKVLNFTPAPSFANPVLESIISTSSGLAVASSVASNDQQPISFLSLATQPNTVMQLVYTMIALAVFLLLILSFVDEMKHAHPVQMAYSFALLFMMGGLYWLHTALTHGAIVV